MKKNIRCGSPALRKAVRQAVTILRMAIIDDMRNGPIVHKSQPRRKTATPAPIHKGRPSLGKTSQFFRNCMGLNEGRHIIDPVSKATVTCTRAAKNDPNHVRRFTVSNHSEKGRNGQNLTSVELRTIFCG